MKLNYAHVGGKRLPGNKSARDVRLISSVAGKLETETGKNMMF